MNWPMAALAGSAFIVLLLAAGVAWFMRDPERHPPTGPRATRAVVAPADGRVLRVEQAPAPAFVAGPAKRIVIFLSVWDVHVQRAPAAGRVAHSERQAGGYRPAFADGAAHNAGHQLGLETAGGRLLVIRTAGVMARRVTTCVALGQLVQAGERIGRIWLGSRAEVFLPAEAVVCVRRGQRVRAGETVIATWGDDERS